MRKVLLLLLLCLIGMGAASSLALAESPASDATSDCLGCHETLHPGITAEWKKSRHAQITPGEAMKVTGKARKVSSETVPDDMKDNAVGCAECHTMRPDAHADTFEHSGYQVHVAVSPDDCATCHATEAEEYTHNLMSKAWVNFVKNPVYQDLQQTINGRMQRKDGVITFQETDQLTYAESCLYCHGTELKVTGTETRDTFFGPMDFPVLEGWPNQGVGRKNLDDSLGSCAACHTRHQFSIEMARKPYTCKECHVGPDVPAYKVYSASKHGNIFSSMEKQWNFTNVPWTVGQDFTAPTCAACHVSLVVTPDGEVLGERTHRMNDRIPWRIFGLIYAHPHPKEADTSIIRNKDGLPLPTDFSGGFAEDYLIDAAEREKRGGKMRSMCRGCHDPSWVNGFWERFENTIEVTNDKTRTATAIMGDIWEEGFAKGLSAKDSPFNEAVERHWSTIWLIYANHVRFASAMAGGGDYGVFADGRYHLSTGVLELQDWLDLRRKVSGKAAQ